jgi:hypothetical protein
MRKAVDDSDLGDDVQRRAESRAGREAEDWPSFTFTPLGADSALGWAGWGAGGAWVPLAAALAEARRAGRRERDDEPARGGME